MAHPQIAAFARMADGSQTPNRKIEGQRSLLGRTMHAIAYDEVHDEIVVPQQLAQAILVFRGAASGEEAPLRVIQGSQTQLRSPDQLGIAAPHSEIFVPEGDRVLVFPREANGNVVPARVLMGDDTLLGAEMLAVDSLRNLLVVSGRPPEAKKQPGGFSIYGRTDQGNTKPRWRIAGPKVGGGGGRVFVYPPRGEIIAVARGFVGVWNIDDQGDVAPRWMIGGPGGVLKQIRGVALDPKHKSVIISDKQLNAILTYSFPEIF